MRRLLYVQKCSLSQLNRLRLLGYLVVITGVNEIAERSKPIKTGISPEIPAIVQKVIKHLKVTCYGIGDTFITYPCKKL